MRTTAALLTLLALASAAAAKPAPRDELAKKIDAYLAPYAQVHAFSGVVLIARGDRVVFQRAYGMANYELSVPNKIDTRFAIASITKMFTTVILEHLYEERKLAPDELLAKWVPNFPSADRITVDQLANHRSGIRDPEKLRRTVRANRTTAEVVDLLKAEPLGSAPGETYSYTTANYAVLAHIIERVTGKSFAEVIQGVVYDPAGMRDSGELATTSVVRGLASGYMPDPFSDGLAVCGPEDTSWKTGGGSSYSTARDLHRFLLAFYGRKLVSKDPLELWSTSKLFGHTSVRASGAFPGANASLLHLPEERLSVVVLSNVYAPLAANITADVAAMYYDEPYRVPSVPKALVNPPPFDARVTGTYDLESFPRPLQILVRRGKPVVFWDSLRQGRMIPIGEHSWFSPLDFATIELTVDADGRVTGGTFNAPWGDHPLKLTRRAP